MVGSLIIAIRNFGGVWARDLGTLPWLTGKEALFGIRIDGLSSLMLLVITIGGWLIFIRRGIR